MDWDKLVQLLVNGVTLGSVYALVALGFSMVYGILKLLNFAHGDHAQHGAVLARIRALAERLDAPVAVLQDPHSAYVAIWEPRAHPGSELVNEDGRSLVWPVVSRGLQTGSAPSARDRCRRSAPTRRSSSS